ncbi:hypothetical protein Tco_0006419 [Tanacetum coccineum]
MEAPVPVAPKVGAATVASPAGVIELDTHSLSEADPSESSPPLVSIAPMVSPFMCSDDSESDTEMSERHVSPTPHDAMRTRWRSRDIPIGRLYHTHPGRPYRALTARKSVRPLPSHSLALRYTSHHLDRFTFGSSLSHSSSDHSSSRHSILGHSLPRHLSPDTTVADSYIPPRFVYPPLARTPRCSEAYLRWRSAPLATMYPPTTSESSGEDSSFESFAGPSCKRYKSPAATVTSSIHATRALVPSRVDLLLPRKRFRDSISTEDSVEEDIDTDVLEDIKADAMAVEVDVRVDVEDEVEDEVESSDRGTIEVGVDMVAGIDILNGILLSDVVEHLEQVEEGLQDIYEHRASLLEQVASLERSNARLRGTMMMEKNMTITRFGMTPEAIEELINQRVEEALAAYEATRAANALEAESQSQNGSDGMVEMEMVEMEMVEMKIQMRITEVLGMLLESRFQELTMMCAKMVLEEEDRVEKIIGGLPDNIQGNVIAAEPIRLQDAVRIANNLMDQKLKGYAMKNA